MQAHQRPSSFPSHLKKENAVIIRENFSYSFQATARIGEVPEVLEGGRVEVPLNKRRLQRMERFLKSVGFDGYK